MDFSARLTQHKHNGISSHIADGHWDAAHDIENCRWAAYLNNFTYHIQYHTEDKDGPTTKSV